LVLAFTFVTAFAIAVALTVIVRRIAVRIGLVDRPSRRKAHEKPTPFGGGIAVVLGMSLPVLGVAAATYAWAHHPSLVPLPETLAVYAEGAALTLPRLVHVLCGGLVMAMLGLLDDLHPLRPLLKLAAQCAIALVITVTSGIRLSAFIPVYWIQVAITVLWIVLLTNSFNLLDNMDGLSATVAFICGGAILVLALQTGQLFIAGFVLALMGSVLGFLYFNFPPASIFMGDAGSMFIGYMLATVTILIDFLIQKQGIANPLFPILVPLVIFAVPLYDTLSVILIRVRHNRPLLVGDRNHFSHRIHRLGMSPRRVLFTVALLALATSLGATIPYGSASWCIAVPAVQAVAVIGVIVELEMASVEIERHEPEGPSDGE